MAIPLVTTEINARGDAAYVMAGGTSSFQERLLGAIDLYKRHRISHIIFMRNDTPLFAYSTVEPFWTQTNWAFRILKIYDVPVDSAIVLRPAESEFLGTLQEARLYRDTIADRFQHLVIITSSAHTRRSALAFRRTLDGDVEIIPYAVTPFSISSERHRPIWLEYAKLIVYFIIA